jgi:hypothetical protein
MARAGAMTEEVEGRRLWISGWLGLLGALGVGIGEFTMQFSPRGGYEAVDYGYFLGISSLRLSWGHFLGVFAAPLYLAGYLHVFFALRPAPAWLRWTVLLLGSYGFFIGGVWLGSRVYLALIVQAAAGSTEPLLLGALLEEAAARNEPLIAVVRVLIGLASMLLVVAIASGRSLYPRWMLLFNPIVLLGVIFASYLLLPSVGVYLLPTAMNVAHLVFFALSLAVLRSSRRRGS